VKPIKWYQIVLPLMMCGAFAALSVRIPRYRFVLLGLGTMVGYAVIQDQVSARLCPEYFTLFHPPIPGLTDPTLLGIGWGFLGAWWGGVFFGLAMGLVATVGPQPPLPLRAVVRPLWVLVVVVAAVTALTGLTVSHHARLLGVSLDAGMSGLVPPENRLALLTVACYHLSAYVTATVGGVIVCVWVRAERRRRTNYAPERGPTNSPD
jgi:hypothetical protein